MKSSLAERLQQLPFSEIAEGLNRDGYGLSPNLLASDECAELIAMYDDSALFRSHIVMSRFGFGRGEYKYFSNPLPDLVRDLRNEFYPRLAPIANNWAPKIGAGLFPAKYADFLEQCHIAGQTKPTPLLLRYETGDFNCLHQDLYGDLSFPHLS